MKRKKDINQERAINFYRGPCLVVSGPGSGKTYVLVNRVYKLITKYKVPPENILVLTFTKAAATEMESRFRLLISEDQINLERFPIFGTFHSVFFNILRRDFGYNASSVLSIDNATIILKRLLKEHKINCDEKLVNNILKDISGYKLAEECNEIFRPKYITAKAFRQIYIDYEKRLYINRKLDFSDMISMCYRLLNSNKEVLRTYQKRFKYVLIDEFQDINRSQYELVKLINSTKNMFVVGDDDQSIYSFRGSTPGVMFDFLNDYKNAFKISLETNYRSVRNIVKMSRSIIDNNKHRVKKNLVAANPSNGTIEIRQFIDSRDENKYIVNKILEYKKRGIKLSDIAVLYRTNLIVDALKQEFEKSTVRFVVKERSDDKSGETSKSVLNAVSFMTFHLSKGLEYKIVFIIDANDGIVPHKKSIKDGDIETERRLFYVALTRAKENLHIYFTTRRFGKNYLASRFILEAVGGVR